MGVSNLTFSALIKEAPTAGGTWLEDMTRSWNALPKGGRTDRKADSRGMQRTRPERDQHISSAPFSLAAGEKASPPFNLPASPLPTPPQGDLTLPWPPRGPSTSGAGASKAAPSPSPSDIHSFQPTFLTRPRLLQPSPGAVPEWTADRYRTKMKLQENAPALLSPET